jgi:peptidoglycan hydrolase-like protein with peptidoglycan-binding domain
MKINKTDLKRQVKLAESRGWLVICRQAEERHQLPTGLLLAIASRETNMEDIVGDAGHGRGLFQIDDRAHGDWLAQHGAGASGAKPPLSDAAEYAAALLDSNRAYGRKKGIGAANLLKFAVSAYNAGGGGALAGHQESGDSDARTTGRDYARDVLERLASIRGDGGNGAGVPAGAEILRRGARGPAVTQLKKDLQTWFDREAPDVWKTFGVAPGPAFGPALDRCVRAFQERCGLEIDGEAGEQTLAALSKAAPTPPAPAPPAPAPSPRPRAPQPKPSPDDGILRRGARGPAVTQLKKDLQAWFDGEAPDVWKTFGVAPGPAFGPALDRAVRAFQERKGLTVDGEVGPQTLAALGVTPAPAPVPPTMPDRPDLRFDAPKKLRSKGARVKLIQGWLCLCGCKVVVDGEFGAATDIAVRDFQAARKLPVTGVVDEDTYTRLVQPMVAALSPLRAKGSLGQLVVAYARQHLKQQPLEVGGQNAGPWVRLYTDGQEGAAYPWCAGFATFCLKQACDTLGVEMPITRTLACDAMANSAGNRLLRQPKPSQLGKITPGSFFLKLATHGEPFRYAHTGIVVEAGPKAFTSIEGNTNDEGSAEGYEVCARTRGYKGMDFIVL